MFYPMKHIQRHKLIKICLSKKTSPAMFSTFREGRGILFGGKDDQPSPCSLPSVRCGGFSLAARTTSLRLVLYLPWGAEESLWRQGRLSFVLFSTFREGRGILFGGKDDYPSSCFLPSLRGRGFSLAERTTILRLVFYLPWGRGILTGGKDQSSPCSLPFVRGAGFSLAARTTRLHLVLYLPWGAGYSLWRQGQPVFALFSTFREGRGILIGGKDYLSSPCSLPSERGRGFSLAEGTTSLRLVLYLP